jgi:hypothetical protein
VLAAVPHVQLSPRHLVDHFCQLKAQMKWSCGLIADENGMADELGLQVTDLAATEWEDSIEAFLTPLSMDLTQDVRQKMLDAQEHLAKRLRIRELDMRWSFGKNRSQ